MRSRVFGLSLALLALGWSATAHAQAPPPPPPEEAQQEKTTQADVMVLHATNAGEGIDKGIGNLPQLKEPPFSSYDTYRLLQRSQFRFSEKEPGELALPNGDTLQLALVKQDGPRIVAELRIFNGKKKKFSAQFKAAKKALFYVAGPRHKDGILVLGLRLDAR